MINFWGYTKNERFSIGCTGQTVYVHDANGIELAKFKDIKYGYMPGICPHRAVCAVKSTGGWLAFYDLTELRLIRKLRVGYDSQDDGFCFSPDGCFFLNLESKKNMCSVLTVYDMDTLTEVARFFSEEHYVLNHIEWDAQSQAYYLLGYERRDENFSHRYFIRELKHRKVTGECDLEHKLYEAVADYKHQECLGFTKKAAEWSLFAFLPAEKRVSWPNLSVFGEEPIRLASVYAITMRLNRAALD